MIKCSKCGFEIVGALPICPSCGQDLKLSETSRSPEFPKSQNTSPSLSTRRVGDPNTLTSQPPQKQVLVPINGQKPKVLMPEKVTKVVSDQLLVASKEVTPSTPTPSVFAQAQAKISPAPPLMPPQPILPPKPTPPPPAVTPLSPEETFIPPKPKLGRKILVFILAFLLVGAIALFALDEFAPGTLPFRLYDLFAPAPSFAQLLPQDSAVYAEVKLDGSDSYKKLQEILKKFPQFPQAQVDKAVGTSFYGLSLEKDILPAVEPKILGAIFSLKSGEQDAVLAVQIRDQNKVDAAIKKATSKETQKNVVEKNYKGSKIFIIEDAQKTLPTVYLFNIRSLWMIASSQKAAEKILDIRETHKLSNLWFGGAAANLSKNVLFGKIKAKADAEKNSLAFAYLSGARAQEAEAPSDILALPFLLFSADEAVGFSFGARDEGLVLRTYLVSQGKEVKFPEFKVSDSYLMEMPEKLRGSAYSFYWESTNFAEVLAHLLGGDAEVKQNFYKALDDTFGIDTEKEFVPLLTKNYNLFLSSLPSAAPDVGAIFKVTDIFQAKSLLEKITGISVKTGGQITTVTVSPTISATPTETPQGSAKLVFRSAVYRDVTILTASDPSWGGMSLSIALADDNLIVTSTQRLTRDLVSQFNNPSEKTLKDVLEIAAQLKIHPTSVSAFLFASPNDFYRVFNGYLGDGFSGLSADTKTVLEGFLKTLSSLGMSTVVTNQESDTFILQMVTELPVDEKTKAEDALGKLLEGFKLP